MSPNLLVFLGLLPAYSKEDFLRLAGLGSGEEGSILRYYEYYMAGWITYPIIPSEVYYLSLDGDLRQPRQ